MTSTCSFTLPGIRAGLGVDVYLFEVAELVDILLAALDFLGIVHAAFPQAQFAADDIVARSGIARNADLLNEYLVAAVDGKNDIHLLFFGLDIGKR